MDIFKIKADEFEWIGGAADDPKDLCLHGHVTVQLGDTILENKRAEIKLSGKTITFLGVDDPSFNTDYLFGDAAAVISTKLTEIMTEEMALLSCSLIDRSCLIPM